MMVKRPPIWFYLLFIGFFSILFEFVFRDDWTQILLNIVIGITLLYVIVSVVFAWIINPIKRKKNVR